MSNYLCYINKHLKHWSCLKKKNTVLCLETRNEQLFPVLKSDVLSCNQFIVWALNTCSCCSCPCSEFFCVMKGYLLTFHFWFLLLNKVDWIIWLNCWLSTSHCPDACVLSPLFPFVARMPWSQILITKKLVCNVPSIYFGKDPKCRVQPPYSTSLVFPM